VSPVNFALELSKQCLEGFELTKRELLQQFHSLSLSTLTVQGGLVALFLMRGGWPKPSPDCARER
jgi:hypothetical protein